MPCCDSWRLEHWHMIGSLGNMELVDGLHLSSAVVMKTLSKYAGHAASAATQHRRVRGEQEQ